MKKKNCFNTLLSRLILPRDNPGKLLPGSHQSVLAVRIVSHGRSTSRRWRRCKARQSLSTSGRTRHSCTMQRQTLLTPPLSSPIEQALVTTLACLQATLCTVPGISLCPTSSETIRRIARHCWEFRTGKAVPARWRRQEGGLSGAPPTASCTCPGPP